MTGPREKAYDEKIAPLMTEIIKVCKEHKIPMIASFELDLDRGQDNPLMCTTILLEDPKIVHSSDLKKAAQILRPNKPIWAIATTIVGPHGPVK